MTPVLARPSKARLMTLVAIMVAAAAMLLAGAGRPSASSNAAKPESDSSLPVVALHGYNVSLFARGTTSWFAPDSIVVDEDHVYVDYQNKTAKDCSDQATRSSTVVQYSRDGESQRHWSIPGHSDGLRLNPATHLLWATVCEDGNPSLYTINPREDDGSILKYSLGAPHGGGYDDIAFTGGKAFLSASNPTLNGTGVNTNAAVVTVTLNPDHTTTLTPVLAGNAASHDIVSNTNVTLNEVDPDSMSIDNSGQLLLVNQGGAEVVFIANPGTAGQTVTNAPVGTQPDDTVSARHQNGGLFITDGTQNATYIIRTRFVAGTLYTQTPNDSGVAGLVGTVDLATGQINPIAIGFGKPTGMVFVSDDTGSDH